MKRSNVSVIIAYTLLGIGAITMLLPFFWMITTSLKSQAEVFADGVFGERLVWENYTRMMERFPFWTFFLNSVKISAIVVTTQLFTSSMAGFVFARMRFRGKEPLFLLYLATMMIPVQVTLIPNFLQMKMYGFINTHWALILPLLVSVFGTFLLRQFYMTVPAALEDAAKIDGCTPFGTYWRIFLPLSGATLATLGIFAFMYTWNDYFNPLIYINSEKLMTLPLGLASMQGMYATDWTALMAGTIVSLIPVIVAFLLAQNMFVQGITLSGLKGE